jgi:transcriptional regulator with XRE-family HTH domain
VSTAADQARDALGIRLRDLRRDAGLSGVQLAKAAGWLPSKVSKIEHGRQTPSESDLDTWCRHCGARSELPDLIAMVRTIETQFAEWRRVLRAGTKHRQQASATIYDRARLFRIFEPAVVPGIFQTKDYAVAVLSVTVDFFQIPDDAQAGADARVAKQAILNHRDRRFHVVIGEQALRTDVGGFNIMQAQLEHLLAATARPNVRIGVVPVRAAYRVPLHKGFWILDDKLAQFDTYTAEFSSTRPDEIVLYERAFERLSALAVYGSEASDLISAAMLARP